MEEEITIDESIIKSNDDKQKGEKQEEEEKKEEYILEIDNQDQTEYHDNYVSNHVDNQINHVNNIHIGHVETGNTKFDKVPQLDSAGFYDNINSLDSLLDKKHSAATEQQIKILKQWVTFADLKKKEYLKAYQKYKSYNNIKNVIRDIITGTFSGGAIIELINIESDDPDKVFKIITFCASLILLIIGAYERAYDPASKSISFLNSMRDYDSFSRDMKAQFVQGIEERPDKLSEFMINSSHKFDSIVSESIPL